MALHDEVFVMPETVEYKGVTYNVYGDHRNIIDIFEIVNDNTIDDVERGIAVVTKLFGCDIPYEQPVIEYATKLLMLGKDIKEQKSRKRDMDFIQDYKIIRADIKRFYGIDIKEEYVTFDDFVSYVEALDETSLLNRTRNLRNYDVSKLEGKEKAMLIEAKESVKLREPDTRTPEQVKIDEMYSNIRKG